MAEGLAPLYPRLWRFCLVLTKDRATADDLAQSACARALEQSDKFAVGTNLDRWVFTIARRLWLNDIRHTKLRQGQGLVAVEETEIKDESPPTETNIFARQVLNKVQALPDKQRLCVLLVYVEGYSYAEAAETLDIPIATVMSRLSAARRMITNDVEMTGTDT